ncbi:MAG: hypothetical protein Q9204_006104 [Flavoplaca sp. TL-2023a]
MRTPALEQVSDLSTPEHPSDYVPRDLLDNDGSFYPDLSTVYRIAWITDGDIVAQGLYTERFNEIVDMGEGCGVLYRTWELQCGPLAQVIKDAYEELLQDRFEDWANGSKAESEGIVGEGYGRKNGKRRGRRWLYGEWTFLPTMPDDDDSKGAHDIIPSIDEPGRKDSILSILDKLAMCLVRTRTETAAVSLFGMRLEFAGHDLAGQVPQASSDYNIPGTEDSDMRIEQINSGNAKIAIIAAQKEKADSKSAVDDPISDLTSYARKVSPMTAVLYQYYSNPGCASYQNIDFNAHARKVFSLLQHCLRESENFSQQPAKSQEDVFKLRMEFYRYVIGMSLPKLAVYTEQHDITSQKNWVGFHAFLKHPVKAEDFEIQPNNKLHWSQTDRNHFLAILKLTRINLNPWEKQIFCKDDIEFDKAVAFIFHDVVSKLLHCILAYVGILVAKQEGDTKTTNLAVGEEEFGYYLHKLVLALQDLARFTRLPNALKHYVESVKPSYDSSSDVALEDGTTNDEALSLRVNSEKAIKDEQVGHNDTDGAANANPKEPQAEGCCDVSTWRARYQHWISSIVRQSRAISSLVQLTQKGHTQRIENLSFIPIHTDPPTSGMEDWIQTIKRAFAVEIPGSEYYNECHRIIAALQGLCKAADNQEAYSWLDKTKWKFSGTEFYKIPDVV